MRFLQMDDDDLTPEKIKIHQAIINARTKALEKKVIKRLTVIAKT